MATRVEEAAPARVGGEMQSRNEALVTGARGFLGRQLVAYLVAHGYRVRGIDTVDGTGDVRRDADVARLVPEQGVVFHLASVVGVVNVLDNPDDTWSTSVEGTEVVCRAALDRGTRVVFTSSSEVYGDGRGLALVEDGALPTRYGAWPRASYPEGKRVAEQIVLDFCQKGGDGRIARLFNVSGPGQSHSGGMVLPTFVRAALRGEPMPIVGDGSDVRCFQHVHDAVRGLVALAMTEHARGEIVNLGGERSVTVRDLAERVQCVLGVRTGVRRVTSAERYGSPATRCAHRVPDLARSRHLLEHRPALALDAIVRDLASAAEPGHVACVESPVTLAS